MAEKRKRQSTTPGKGKKTRTDFGGDVFDPLPPSDTYRNPWEALGAWFLGPRAENKQLFNHLIGQVINWHSECREGYYPTDPTYINNDVKSSSAYRSEVQDTEEQLKVMFDELKDSIPFFSTRYQGHMTWECTLPAMLGYFSGMLWNQNNVDSTASPVTTKYEIQVGQHLCQLMNFDNNALVTPWAHITGCGSVANLEAMWAARNLKFHPIAVQAVVTSKNAGKLAKGADTPVYVPELDDSIPLNQCSIWQLLNLDVDTVCKLTDKVSQHAGLKDNELLEEKLKSESVINIGMAEFMSKHKSIKTPVVCSPGTNHYSWPKSATVLGIGDQHVIPINVDGNARQKMHDLNGLDDELGKCLKDKRSVFMVVAVIGTTEEGAIDPLQDILDLRDQYRKKGLNFAVHADAAWGGYMLTMLQPPSNHRLEKCSKRGEDFVPNIPLSAHSIKQYRAIKHADTVTIDPHKAGLCLYPAGALCYRNGIMKAFITLKAPEVTHNPDDMTVGVFGLEGSKPGAAAAGVMLSHRVIGLDQLGYGRILGQCQLGSKLFYCLWMTVAQEWDDWVCINFINMPELPDDLPQTEQEQKEFIRTRILGKNNVDLANDEKAMKFLTIVGPDALINSFVVNMVGNTENLEALNTLQMDIFNETNVTVGQHAKRVPIFLTTSIIDPDKYGDACKQLKQRLNISAEGDLGFLRNTCINPFQSSEKYITEFGKLFRNVVLNCIGGLKNSDFGDPQVQLNFVVSGRMNKHGKVFLDFMPSFGKHGSQYHVVLTMVAATEIDRIQFRKAQKHQQQTFFFTTKAQVRMKDFLGDTEKSVTMEVYKGKPNHEPHRGTTKIMDISLKVDEVFRYNHLESLKASEYIEYPEHQTYFLYGNEKRAFISHVPTKSPDFHQVVELDEKPHSITDAMLDLGVIITIPEIPGKPYEIRHKISDSLQRESYTVDYRGVEYSECQTTIKLFKRNAKKWFSDI